MYATPPPIFIHEHLAVGTQRPFFAACMQKSGIVHGQKLLFTNTTTQQTVESGRVSVGPDSKSEQASAASEQAKRRKHADDNIDTADTATRFRKSLLDRALQQHVILSDFLNWEFHSQFYNYFENLPSHLDPVGSVAWIRSGGGMGSGRALFALAPHAMHSKRKIHSPTRERAMRKHHAPASVWTDGLGIEHDVT